MKFFSKNMSLLLGGRVLSAAGKSAFDFLGNTFLSSLGKKYTFLVVIFQSSGTFVSIFFNLVGGAFADRTNRKNLLIITDLICGGFSAALAFFANAQFFPYLWIVGIIMLSIMYAFNYPAYKAFATDVLTSLEIGPYNSYSKGISQLVSMVIPVVGAFALLHIGIQAVLIIDAILFFVATFLNFRVNISTDNSDKNVDGSKDEPLLAAIIGGFRYLLGAKQLLVVVLMVSLVNFFVAGYELYLPYTNESMKIILSSAYSKILAVQSLGGIFASLIAAKMKKPKLKSQIWLVVGMGVCLVLVPPVVSWHNPSMLLMMFLLFSLLMSIFNIVFFTYIQINVLDEYLGRVISIVTTVAIIFAPVGSVVFSLLNVTKIINFSILGVSLVIVGIICGVFSWRVKV